MQIHGGYGYSREYPLERAYRDIRGLCFGAGTVEAQRNYMGCGVAGGSRTGSPGWRAPLDGVLAIGVSGHQATRDSVLRSVGPCQQDL